MLKELNTNIENLRLKAESFLAISENAKKESMVISQLFDLKPQQAANAFVLQNDTAFQASMEEYGKLSARIAYNKEIYGANSPKLKESLTKQSTALRMASERSELLTGIPLNQSLASILSVNSGESGKGNLLEKLVTQDAIAKAKFSEYISLQKSIRSLQKKLEEGSKQLSELEVLQRDVEIAEAIFASTLTKLDLSQADRFAAYPLVQTIEPPTIPSRPYFPDPRLLLLGGVIGCSLSSLATFILWKRKNIYSFASRLLL